MGGDGNKIPFSELLKISNFKGGWRSVVAEVKSFGTISGTIKISNFKNGADVGEGERG